MNHLKLFEFFSKNKKKDFYVTPRTQEESESWHTPLMNSHGYSLENKREMVDELDGHTFTLYTYVKDGHKITILNGFHTDSWTDKQNDADGLEFELADHLQSL